MARLVKGLAKKAVRYAEARGYRFERQNSKCFMFYRNAAGHEVGISPGIDDKGFRLVCQQIDRANGVGPDLSQKRNSEQIKARQQRTRALLLEEKRRHRERIDFLLRQKHELALGGLGRYATDQQIKDIERLLEEEESAHRETVRMMTARPEPAA